MYRLLIVEDDEVFYQDYMLRIFTKLLPLEKISILQVPTLEAALVALQEPWDFILMDHALGRQTHFLGDLVRDGVDLISFRRTLEKTRPMVTAFILGTASNDIGNKLLEGQGANGSALKLHVETMAQSIKEAMRNRG